MISPLDKKKESPVDQYLSATVGTPYHICYRSTDFDNDVKNLETGGYKVVIEPKTAVAFGDKRVAFLMNIGFGLMEIVEK